MDKRSISHNNREHGHDPLDGLLRVQPELPLGVGDNRLGLLVFGVDKDFHHRCLALPLDIHKSRIGGGRLPKPAALQPR